MQSKLPNINTTIFSIMSALAEQHQAINLAQGFPDFPCDPLLTDAVCKAMKDGHNQYAPMAGIIRLRNIISDYIFKLYSSYYIPETEITITSGATEALFAAIASVVNQGDEVIIFEPCYDCYAPTIELNGGKVIPIELISPDFTIDHNQLKEKINKRTKLIILNSPHNPTGSTLKCTDIELIKELLKSYRFYILSDEVYEHLVYDDKIHYSIAADPELKQHSFVVFSFGKSLHVTGWKIGYCLAPEQLTSEFRKIHQYLTFCTHLPTQVAIADYLQNNALEKFSSLKAMYQAKRNYFSELMKQSRFKPIQSSGTYFELYSYSDLSQEADTDFAVRVTKEFGVATIPVSAFYSSKKDDKLLRFCFAKKEETLFQAVERLCKI